MAEHPIQGLMNVTIEKRADTGTLPKLNEKGALFYG